MKDIWKLYDICVNQLDSIGIVYSIVDNIVVNRRAKAMWGRCTDIGNRYKIEISVSLLEDNVDDMATLNTLMHELLHTCDGCMNHGAKWKEYANMVNNTYGYSIKRCTSAKEKGLKEREHDYHFIVHCNQCNYDWKYQRYTKTVKSCEHNRATCSCGGRDFKVIHI